MGDQMKNDEVGGACGTYGGQERFCLGDLVERNHLEDLSLDGKIILKWMGWGGMNWSDMGQNRYRWRVLVNAVMNLQVQ
jgi:hypothetical protein